MRLIVSAFIVVFCLAAALGSVTTWAAAVEQGHSGMMHGDAGHSCPMGNCGDNQDGNYRCIVMSGHCEVPQIQAIPVASSDPATTVYQWSVFTAHTAEAKATAVETPPPRV